MRVIKRIEPPSANRLVRFDCPHCHSRLEENKCDLEVCIRNEGYYYFICPVCGECHGVGEDELVPAEEDI